MSNRIAIKLIHNPASKANPIFNWFKANNKLNPKPLAPMKAEITAIEKHTMITWFTPIKISLLAVGINTLVINCQLLHPLILPASITSGGTALNPNKVKSIIGGTATIIVIITAA